MNNQIHRALLLGALALSSCGGGSSSAGGNAFDILEISHGFGLMIPHQVRVPDANGFPTSQVVVVKSEQNLLDNVTLNNPILPIANWPATAELPNGMPGNQFIYVEFNRAIDIASILSSSPSAQASAGLTGPITVVAQDPVSGVSTPVPGRAFVAGRTFAGTPVGTPPVLLEETWVTAGPTVAVVPIVDSTGAVIGTHTPGVGFPGTSSTFAGASKLVSPNTFVFVADIDGDLSTPDTFPVGRQIKLKVTRAVRSTLGEGLLRQAVASTTVGLDSLSPEVSVTPAPLNNPAISPGNGDPDVDPQTDVLIEFTEPLQPLTVGPFPSSQVAVGSAVSVTFGPTTSTVSVPFSVMPESVFDLSTYRLCMAFDFPGSGPSSMQCGTFNRVQVDVANNQIQDLTQNFNTLPQTTFFFTGEGAGLVNAPVVPEAIYVSRGGAEPGVSVIDLNGFGGSTGNPTFDFSFNTFPEGNSNYPNNLNVQLQGAAMVPPLAPGTCTVDGGSAGVFTLTLDSSLDSKLIKPPQITSSGEIMIGQSLDQVFHNGQEATGCQSQGGGNLCATNGLKIVTTSITAQGSIGPPVGGQVVTANIPGGPNPASFAPHPNPPPLVFPPICLTPLIGGSEVTSIEVLVAGGSNLLVPGDAQGDPVNGTPPSGLLARSRNTFFVGPGRPGQPIASCANYQVRQQIGHFLYMIDRSRRELVVLNSNRFFVLDRIPLPDPTSMAMGPNMNFLAVTNQAADTVSFINIDPRSPFFHTVQKTTSVGRSPRGVAWDPGNEDILVCNESENTMSVISAFDLNVRKVVSSQLNRPFEVVITPRQLNFGHSRNVYFGWILNRDGRLALFESGPDGVNGWGFDDVIGVPPFTFINPKGIRVDPFNVNGSVWILHENELLANGQPSAVDGGAVTNLSIETSQQGTIFLNPSATPSLRSMTLEVTASIGPNRLTGIPVDIAFDNNINLTATLNFSTTFSAGEAADLNGKSVVRPVNGVIPAEIPRFMLLAVPNSDQGPGVVDVINLESGGLPRFDTNAHQPGIQSIPAPGVFALSDYFRQ